MQTIRTDPFYGSDEDREKRLAQIMRQLSREHTDIFITMPGDHLDCSLSDRIVFARERIIFSFADPKLTRLGKALRDRVREIAAGPRAASPFPEVEPSETLAARHVVEDRCRAENAQRLAKTSDMEPYFFEERVRWGTSTEFCIMSRNNASIEVFERPASAVEATKLVQIMNRAHRAGYKAAIGYVTAFAHDIAEG